MSVDYSSQFLTKGAKQVKWYEGGIGITGLISSLAQNGPSYELQNKGLPKLIGIVGGVVS